MVYFGFRTDYIFNADKLFQAVIEFLGGTFQPLNKENRTLLFLGMRPV
jgi:hypothetical protein